MLPFLLNESRLVCQLERRLSFAIFPSLTGRIVVRRQRLSKSPLR